MAQQDNGRFGGRFLFQSRQYAAPTAGTAARRTHPRSEGPWQRLDGAKFADSFAQIRSDFVHALLNVTETGTRALSQSQYVWTSMNTSGSVTAATCNTWSQTGAYAWASRLDAVGPTWPPAYQTTIICEGTNPLYCPSDSARVFRYGFD
ncbi:hypothetical protein [Tahibacter harae]|uniref:Uncharacterized protein n=1 Tax=Tahibacter harae TaxID=2963937 RepID=A0ABT1QLL9_9GAMM|nr:hypothetical protein [Tahibacter harae]MCQ4163418.1 hypothetical protein [Tahibacter harae]